MAVELSFTDMGAGKPLVILHGLFGSKRNWTNIAHRFAAGRRVLTADLRNHGESPWDARHDYPAMAEDVAELIRAQVGGPADVVGHSMGGKVAMMLALDLPELVERLVVVDIAPAVSTGTPVEYLRALRSLPLDRFSNRADVKDALAGAIPDPAMRAFLMLNLATGPTGLSWTVNLDAIDTNFPTILGFPAVPPGRRFKKPALFLVGDRSDYVRPHHRPEIERLFPAATIEVIDGAGHWVHADAADAFVTTVTRFLQA